MAGHVIEGGVLSTRLTVNEQVEALLEASVAVKVTVVEPTPETGDPTAGLCVTVTDEQLSPVVASAM